jgi:hypothetical protein
MSYYAQKVTFIVHIQPAKVNISRITRSAISTSTSCQSNSVFQCTSHYVRIVLTQPQCCQRGCIEKKKKCTLSIFGISTPLQKSSVPFHHIAHSYFKMDTLDPYNPSMYKSNLETCIYWALLHHNLQTLHSLDH